MEFMPNEIYTCYGKVDTVNTSDGIYNYQVTLKDDTQVNLKVNEENLLNLGDVYLFKFECKFNGTRNSF